jgi:predicted SAM-dependent methyltransferase
MPTRCTPLATTGEILAFPPAAVRETTRRTLAMMKPQHLIMSVSVKELFPAKWRDQWRLHWVRLQRFFRRPPFPQNEGNKVYVHLGCGVVNHPKFINVDTCDWPHVHYVQSVKRLNRFHDNSVDLIYCCHCLEHISHVEVPMVLREWRRVLKPSGILRLSVPDFDRILKIYADNDRLIEAIERQLFGGQDYTDNFHNSVYNRKHLEKLLSSAGFRNIREWQPSSDELTTFNDWSAKPVVAFGKSYPISLNLEGEKPAGSAA